VKGASAEHECGIVLNEWHGMTVHMSEHGVAAPAADDLDFVAIAAGKEELLRRERADMCAG
jgi:hypothetical protein